MIVKLQLSLASTGERRQMLVYNKDHSLMFQGDVSRDVVALMGDKVKAFFHARVVDERVVIGEPAPWQEW